MRILPALAAGLLVGACATAPAPPLELRLVAFNDFHGNLETPASGWSVPDAAAPGGKSRIPAGGVAHLATAVRELRAGKPHSAVVSAGDLVSASPLPSALFHDEPTVTALDALGLEFSAPGNHEFDRGRAELERLVGGGCHPKEGCTGAAWAGARYGYLAANVVDKATGRTLFPPYAIRHYDGIPVAFVGAALRSTPILVERRGIASLDFRDEAESVNALVPELRRQGVETIVVLLHEGGAAPGDPDDASCPGFEGDVTAVVKRLDPAVDVVVTGHTHESYRCRIDGRLVTSAASYGRLVTAIDLAIDRATRDVVSAEARNHVVDPRRYAADPALADHVRQHVQLAQERTGRVVGIVRGEFTPKPDAAGESNLGALVARAHLEAMAEAAGAEIAFMNPGGLRAPLASRRPDGGVTVGDLFAVQPFGNVLMATTLTGAQVLRVLEEQWTVTPAGGRILQVAGIAYAWDGSRPAGKRIVPGSVRVGGEPLDPARSYRVAMNSFLHAGGDGFTVFGEGREPAGGPGDHEALQRLVAKSAQVAGPPPGNIRRIDVR